MRFSISSSRFFRPIKSRRAHRAPAILKAAFEALEPRRLMSVVELAPVQSFVAHPDSPASDTINLVSHFETDTVGVTPGSTIAEFTFRTNVSSGDNSPAVNLGVVDVDLTDAATPLTVANFKRYAANGGYNNTILHRSAVLAGGTPSATTPADIIQGGGYFVNGTLRHLGTFLPIKNEVATEAKQNVAGTIAMAKTSDPNSATSEFYFNIHDNSGLDDTNNSGGFTTFGSVIGDGMTVLNSLAQASTVNIGGSFTQLPIEGATPKGITVPNLIFEDVSTAPDITYTVTSSNPDVVNPVIDGNTLSFQYATGGSGTATISVSAVTWDGATLFRQFDVTVPDPATPTNVPVAVADTPANVVTGSSLVFSPTANDIDSSVPLDTTSVQIVTPPSHGTASFDSGSRQITYIPAAGFTGTDTLQYTVADANGTRSAPGDVTFNVVGNPVQVTIGTRTARFLQYTDPDGTLAKLAISGATSVITFAGPNVQLTTSGVVAVASGPDASIADIKITAIGHAQPLMTVTTRGGADGVVSIGTIEGVRLSGIIAPGVNITGKMQIVSATRYIVASTSNCELDFGGDCFFMSIPVATNTIVDAAGTISVLRSNSWVSTNGFDHGFSAASIGTMSVTGEFANSLTLAGGGLHGVDLRAARVGSLTLGKWTVPGTILSLFATSVAPGWSLTTQNLIRSVRTLGDFDGSITCGALGSVIIGGNMAGGSLATDAPPNTRFVQMPLVFVAGSISNSSIQADGNIGSIVSASITGTDIFAGTGVNVPAGQLATGPGDFPAVDRLVAIRTKSFSNSRIDAATIGTLSLGTISTGNGGNPTGVSGHTLSLILGTLDTGVSLRLTRAQLKSATALSDFFTANAIDATHLGDFKISVL